jgi:hypothetical protein
MALWTYTLVVVWFLKNATRDREVIVCPLARATPVAAQ